ncbi:MAG: DNA-binding HxlR family transcriptional regulator [Hyphomicrobiaceae bacterium]|jgi:DNA-binding HxlR family transcriptional regulator
MAALDLLGRRWTLRILWEIGNSGPLTFRGIQEACGGLSPTVVNTRLRELRENGIVSNDEQGYALTAQGRRLGKILQSLDLWSNGWAKTLG